MKDTVKTMNTTNHKVVHLKCMQFLIVSYISIKLGGGKETEESYILGKNNCRSHIQHI